jgi:hypothetical protein
MAGAIFELRSHLLATLSLKVPERFRRVCCIIHNQRNVRIATVVGGELSVGRIRLSPLRYVGGWLKEYRFD